MEANSINKKILLAILIAGCFISTLNQTLLNVALSDLMLIFDVSAATVQWLATGFMLVNGVLVPVTAFLMKRFTTRQLFLSSMLFLLAGSLISGTAVNFGMLLTGRMVQAVGAGIILPLMMSVILYIYPPERRGSVMGLIGFAIIFAPAIAPTLAGFLIEYVSWRWLFIGLVPFVAIIIALAFRYLVNVAETERAKVDLKSVILSTAGFGLVLYGFSSAGNAGWSDPLVLFSIIGGLIFTAFFCFRQVKSPDPLLNLSVFSYKVFTITSLVNVIITIIMYADLILLPIYLQTGRGFTAFEAGLLLLPGAIINAFLSPVTGRLYDKYGAKPLFLIGLILITISVWAVTDLTESTTYLYLMVRTIILRIGLSFITMPLNTAALNALPLHLGTHGSAVNTTVRQLAGAIGTAVVVTVYSTQMNLHSSLIESAQGEATAAQITSLSSIASSADAYQFLLILCLAGLALVFMMPKKPKAEPEKESEPAEA